MISFLLTCFYGRMRCQARKSLEKPLFGNIAVTVQSKSRRGLKRRSFYCSSSGSSIFAVNFTCLQSIRSHYSYFSGRCTPLTLMRVGQPQAEIWGAGVILAAFKKGHKWPKASSSAFLPPCFWATTSARHWAEEEAQPQFQMLRHPPDLLGDLQITTLNFQP